MKNTVSNAANSTTNKTVQEIASKVLGEKTGEYKNYTPEVLTPVPRNLSIEHIGVKMETLAGEGFDLWYSYEFRCRTNQGLPVAAAIKFIIPHTSKNIIESKSFKLYCNSFTAEKLGETKKEALAKACEIMHKDLSKAADGEVTVSVVNPKKRSVIFDKYKELTTLVDPTIEVNVYNEDPSLLVVQEGTKVKEHRLKFDALRSKCRITNQPDSGTMYLYYKSKKVITEESLVKYFASFSEECHFHEEILITAFSRIQKLLDEGDALLTAALYQRRGSLDIGPIHFNNVASKGTEAKILLDVLKTENFAYDPNNIYR